MKNKEIEKRKDEWGNREKNREIGKRNRGNREEIEKRKDER